MANHQWDQPDGHSFAPVPRPPRGGANWGSPACSCCHPGPGGIPRRPQKRSLRKANPEQASRQPRPGPARGRAPRGPPQRRQRPPPGRRRRAASPASPLGSRAGAGPGLRRLAAFRRPEEGAAEQGPGRRGGDDLRLRPALSRQAAFRPPPAQRPPRRLKGAAACVAGWLFRAQRGLLTGRREEPEAANPA